MTPPLRPGTRLLLAELRLLAEAGLTRAGAAAAVGCSYRHVRALAKQHAIPFVSRYSMSAARAAEIAELRRGGMTCREIAQRYGLSRQRVHQICARFGIPGDVHMSTHHRATVRCQHCGETYVVRKCEGGQRKFCSRRCRIAYFGADIVRRRLAGEKWQDIAEAMGRNRLYYDVFCNHARRYLDAINASQELRDKVFPGKGGGLDATARARMSVAQRRRHAAAAEAGHG